MITKDNLKKVLSFLGFEKETVGEYYSKIYSTCSIHVDFDNETLVYPEDKGLVVNDRTTSNFSHNENFVVFECVCRLLDKGYRPEHIELEPKWQLGRDAKSGKADIVVKDENGSALIIIECKTSGAEYNKEIKNTEEYGGQLFSYWQQENAARWLALYTSDWKDGDIVVKSKVINCSDDANIIKMAEKDKNVLVYCNAHNDEERFNVWDETYNKAWLDNVIFDDDSQAYNIGIPPLRKNKLCNFTPDDKIVNRFEEILRHNNVSDKENAFNRLIALFICKLVDEIKKQDFEEVEFQYKPGTDTYESLQDRLQRLHTQGMEEFMKEKIFYVAADYAERLFMQYTGKKRKQAIEDLNNTIRILKFYSNNDFAFKDVHNEELFFQNGKILVEVVQLFQPYRIVYPSKHQFLGDLFEQLLNKGFKQNEGQFFTPTPITRFIWDCLPLQTYISNHGLPNVIDYACGAGHFLTEAVEAINAVRKNNENSWVEKHIYGIEKDLYYFALVREQRTLIITAPSDNKEQKLFLGYDWSNRKGAEGIIINTPGGKLYNQEDRFARGTLACAVRNSFLEADTILSDVLMNYAHNATLKNLFDWSKSNFDKAIGLITKRVVVLHSYYPIKKISDLILINEKDKNPTESPDKNFIYVDISSVENGTGIVSYDNKLLGKNAPSRARRYALSGSTLVSTVRPNLRAFAYISEEHKEAVYSTGFAILRSKDEKRLLNKLIYIYFMNLEPLMEQIIEKMPKGQYPSINKADIESLQIPVPPIEIQKKIISECEAIDAEYNTSRMSIETYRQKISDIFNKLEVITKDKMGGGKNA